MLSKVKHAIRIIRKNSNPEVRRMLARIFIDYFKECGVETGVAADQLHAGRFVDECVKELDLFGLDDEGKLCSDVLFVWDCPCANCERTRTQISKDELERRGDE